jgi:hypothetical protein
MPVKIVHRSAAGRMLGNWERPVFTGEIIAVDHDIVKVKWNDGSVSTEYKDDVVEEGKYDEAD